MIQTLAKYSNRPLAVSLFGWILFLGMYLLVGIFSVAGMSTKTSFIVASLVGILGFLCWLAALIISVVQLFKGLTIGASIGAFFLSLIPLSFLTYSFFIAANGGV